jgi:SAM-dependent methyltransferase
LKQTPALDIANPDLLAIIPRQSACVVEVGSGSGALAKAFKAISPACHYTGIEIEADYAKASARFCDRVLHASVESLDEQTFESLFPSDCWIFGDSLEHLVDPWQLLAKIRKAIDPAGCVVACIPNAQHWSVQARLNCGLFRYENSGLLDRTHLRWFTRQTILEMFTAAGYSIVDGGSRVLDDAAKREVVMPAIAALARAITADPEEAMRDAVAFQYVVRAVPV